MLLDTPLVAGFGSTTQALKTTTTTQTKTGLFKPTNNLNNSAKKIEKQIVLEVIEKVLFFFNSDYLVRMLIISNEVRKT